MKDILILGAGGFGRELYGYAQDCVAAGAPWRLKGFIDDNPDALAGYDYPHGVISSIKDYRPRKGEALLVGIGLPKAKKEAVEFLREKGAEFETLVHPSAKIGRNAKYGAGCVFAYSTILTCDCLLGDFVTINAFSGCGHDSMVGSWSTLSSHCDVTGHVKLGEGVFFASGVSTVPSSKVGDWASVGINSSVIMSVKPGVSAFGNPAVGIGRKKGS